MREWDKPMKISDDQSKNEELLKKAIKNNEIGNLYLFYGPEEYLKRNYTEYIEKILLPEESRLFNKVVLDGKTTAAAIIDHCETLPAFSDRRVVVVKNSGFFKGKKGAAGESDGGKRRKSAGGKDGKGGKSSREDELADFLEDVPEHTCLIFIESEIDKRIKYIDIIKKHGLIVEFARKRPEELAGWAVRRAKALGYAMAMNTAAQLVEYCEDGMDSLLNEITKLCGYAGDRKEIVLSDIESVCTKSVKSRVFDLTDAIAARQTAKAMMLLNDMAVLKEPMPKVMFMIARQFRQLLQVKLLLGEGMSTSGITSFLKLSPYISGKIIRQARSFSVNKLETAIAKGLELDLAVKTGEMKDRTAVELLIASMSSGENAV